MLNGPATVDINSHGTYIGLAETTIPDPYAPNCSNPECLIYHAQKWRHGKSTDLGSLPGVNNSGATCINAHGIIVGGSQNSSIDPLTGLPEDRGVVWSKDGRIFDLGTLDGGTHSFASFINDRNEIIGSYSNTTPDPYSMQFTGYQTHAFLWRHGKMEDLGTLGGPDAFPEILNDRGQIAGVSYTNSTPNAVTGIPTQDPFIWESGKMRDLGTLGGTIGAASYINSRGQIVGTSNLAGDTMSHAFIWENGEMRDLGTLGGNNSNVYKINDSGAAVGRADFPGDVIHHGFLWKNGQLTDLGTVAGDLCTNAFGINSQGKIVGTSSNCQGLVQHLVLWENGHIVNLNSLLLPGPAIHLEHAYDINDRDEIAASGTLPNGDYHAVLLIPCDNDHSHVEGCEDHVEELVTTDDPSLATAQVPTQTLNPTGRASEIVRKRTDSRDYVRRRTVPERPQ